MDLDDDELRATRMMNGADRNGRANKMEKDIEKVYKLKINKLEEENSKLQENNEEIKEKFLRNIEETEKLKKQLQSNIRVFNKTIDEQNKKIKELEEEIMQKDLEIIGVEEYTKESMGEIIEHYYTANEDCIPVSLVEETIEEINKLITEAQKELGSASKEYTIYVYQKDILQELLEKRK